VESFVERLACFEEVWESLLSDKPVMVASTTSAPTVSATQTIPTTTPIPSTTPTTTSPTPGATTPRNLTITEDINYGGSEEHFPGASPVLHRWRNDSINGERILPR